MAAVDKQDFTLLKILQKEQQITCQKLMEEVNKNVLKELSNERKKEGHERPFSNPESTPNWLRIHERRSQHERILVQDEKEEMEKEKTHLIQQIEIAAAEMSELEREKNRLVDARDRLEKEIKHLDRLTSVLKAELDENFAVLGSIKSALENLQQGEKSRLKEEMKWINDTHQVHEESQRKEYEHLAFELQQLLQKEAQNTQETLLKEIKILEIEAEIKFLSNRANDLSLKLQIEKEEENKLKRADEEKTSSLQSVINCIQRITVMFGQHS